MNRDHRIKAVLSEIAFWYRDNRIELPWREDPTPYHVWISEIMLQQTRIEAAREYYIRFIDALPTVRDLATVDDDKLMKLWQGLGYYSRARNLKKAAVTVMEQYGGELPDTAEALLTLPGIGEYTAGAIASIAFGKSEPAVDGNVLRVLSRILASYDDIMLPRIKKEMTALLRAAYPDGEMASLVTEGLMELGEQVCIPNGTPRCTVCPVRDDCLASEKGITEELPVRNVKKEKRNEEKTVLLIRSESGRYAIRKRPSTGLLADMWEFVTCDGSLSSAEIENYLAEHSIQAAEILPSAASRHIFTHVIWNMKGYTVSVRGESPAFVWKTAEEIVSSVAIPTAFKAYLKLLKE